MALRGASKLFALRRFQSVPVALYHENVSLNIGLKFLIQPCEISGLGALRKSEKCWIIGQKGQKCWHRPCWSSRYEHNTGLLFKIYHFSSIQLAAM